MIGNVIGPYHVLERLGAGGMGEVYRARDTTLDRHVALKVLPEALASDSDRLARFEREAKTLASLNHPHIAAIYGFERVDGTQLGRALVMELVEGPTLADRIAAGPLPLEEALSIARQIIEALEAAHEQGIVHRDLKPANIKVRPDGMVKVLDFGLAKAMEPTRASSPDVSQSPTITSPAMTQAGMILGTAAYMSPEQARGLPVDHRSDIFSFGCVLYEMVCGRRPFEGRDVGETLAFVITAEPDLTAVPPRLRALVSRCLAKDRRQRLQAIGEARIAIETLANGPSDDTRGDLPPRSKRHKIATFALAASVVLVVAAAAMFVRSLTPAEAGNAVTRFVVASPPGVAPRGPGSGRRLVAISPRGTHVVYWAGEQLFVRALDQLGDGQPLRGTTGAREPFFSPDGSWVGFHQEGQLKRLSLGGGTPVSLATAENPWGVSWSSHGVIYYGQGNDGIWKVGESGGAPERVVEVGPGEWAHGPQLLPDGRWLLFTLKPADKGAWDDARIVAQSLETGERVVVVDRGRDARYIPATGHIVYGLEGALLAAPFDARTRRVTNRAVPLVDDVMDSDIRTGAMHYAVSDDGTLVYVAGPSGERGSLVWVGPDGRREDVPVGQRQFSAPRLSSDGTRIAFEIWDRSGVDVHVFDLTRRVATQLTSMPLSGRSPLWTLDGRQVVFYSDAGGGGLYTKAADGSGEAVRLTKSASEQVPSSWSPDGRTLFFEQRESASTQSGFGDIYAVPLTGGATPTPILGTPATEGQPALSRDGRWLAYSSDEGGARRGVFIRPFPDVGRARWQVSTEGGHSPLWSPDGSRLFFISDGRAMAASIATQPQFSVAAPVQSFDLPVFYSSMITRAALQWAIAPDGRFLVVDSAPGENRDASRPHVVVVRGWFAELRRLVPVP